MFGKGNLDSFMARLDFELEEELKNSDEERVQGMQACVTACDLRVKIREEEVLDVPRVCNTAKPLNFRMGVLPAPRGPWSQLSAPMMGSLMMSERRSGATDSIPKEMVCSELSDSHRAPCRRSLSICNKSRVLRNCDSSRRSRRKPKDCLHKLMKSLKLSEPPTTTRPSHKATKEKLHLLLKDMKLSDTAKISSSSSSKLEVD